MKFKQYPKYKESKAEWIGEIPEDWKVKKLKYLIKISLQYGANEVGDDENSGGARYIRITDITQDGRILDDSPKSLPFEKAKGYMLNDFDILFARSGATVGKTFQYRKEFGPACFAGYLIRASIQQKHNPQFIYYYTHSNSYLSWLSFIFIKSTIENIGAEKYSNLLVPLPPRTEQDNIVFYLEKETFRVDKLISNYRKVISLLQEKRLALISHAVTKGLNPKAKMKDSGVEWIGEIPEHWGVKKIKHLTTNLDGKRIPISADQRVQGEVPYYGATGIVDHVEGFIFDEELLCVGEDGAPFFEKGKSVSFVIRGKTWVNNHAHVMRVNKLIKAELLMHIMNCVDYSIYIKGSTRDKLNQDELNSIQIAAIPLHEQEEILSYINNHSKKIDELIDKIKKQIDLLNEYKTSLISHAVTGKIDVRGNA